MELAVAGEEPGPEPPVLQDTVGVAVVGDLQ